MRSSGEGPRLRNRGPAVACLALVLRLALLFAWYETGQGARVSGDGLQHYAIAKNLLAGRGFLHAEGNSVSRRAPLYAVFIAAISRWAPFPLGVQIVQVFLGALTVV